MPRCASTWTGSRRRSGPGILRPACGASDFPKGSCSSTRSRMSSRLTLFGPPGTGKTTELLRIVEGELRTGTPVDKIAFVSFTRKAANEARDRAIDQFSLDKKEFKYFRTIHSLAFGQLNLRKDEVMSDENWKELSNITGIAFTGDDDRGAAMSPGDRMLFYFNLMLARGLHPLQVYDDVAAHRELMKARIDRKTYARVYTALEEYKAKYGLVDFSDMLTRAEDELKPMLLDCAIVDEAQDLSLLQWKVLDKLFAHVPRVYFAGDDDQAIYGWSGADVAEFQRRANEGKKKVLAVSHRLPYAVWSTALRISDRITDREPKMWGPRDADGTVTTEHIDFLKRCKYE